MSSALIDHCGDDFDKLEKVNKKIDEIESYGEPDTIIGYRYNQSGIKSNFMTGRMGCTLHELTLLNHKIKGSTEVSYSTSKLSESSKLDGLFKAFVKLDEKQIINGENDIFDKSNPFKNNIYKRVDHCALRDSVNAIAETLSPAGAKRYKNIIFNNVKTNLNNTDFNKIDKLKQEIESKTKNV